MKLQKRPLSLLIPAFLISGITFAQDEHLELERILVTASPLERTAIESAQPIYVLSGDFLRQSQAPTLGETLRDLPGVQSSYYSPTASSPVIRGLDGPRVRILQNGLDVGDVSRGGPDHAVTTETSTARQIEVLRGPATLLYGSGASGGIVNVVDNRVPRSPVIGTEGHVEAGVAGAANERYGSASLQQGTENFAFHIDGFKRDADDYRVPTFTTPDGERAQTIENSFTEDQGATVGASYLFDRGFLGASYGRLERSYGIPGHSHDHGDEHDHGHDEHDDAGIYADSVQDRFQVLGRVEQPFAGFQSLDFNLGYTELTHEELEDEFVESGFGLEQVELRVTGRHNEVWGWSGATGVQFKQQDYTSYGAEAFTPNSDTELAGLFWVGERRVGDITYELGARVEYVEIDTHGLETLSYRPVSLSTGATYRYNPELQFAVSLSYSERAPQAAELFSNGAHFATRTYDLGGIYNLQPVDDSHDHDHDHEEYEVVLSSQGLQKEVATNLDLGVHYDGERFHLDANVFYNQIDDFIYTRSLGFTSGQLDGDAGLGGHDDHGHDHGHDHDDSGLPVYQYMQEDADLYGYEISGHYYLSDHWRVGGFSDYTRAKFSGNTGNVPRIPAQRTGLNLRYTESNWDATIGYTQYWAQNDVADGEFGTDSFGMLNAYLNFYPEMSGRQDLAIYVKAENLNNRLGFVHNSFIKDYAPMPGMNIGAGIRLSF